MVLAWIVALPAAVSAVWLEARVADTDRYVATVGPLADDPDVVAALSELSTSTARDQVADLLGPDIADLAGGLVADSVAAVVASPQFRPVWEAANRSAHEQTIAVLQSDAPVEGGADVTLDFGAILADTMTSLGPLPTADLPPLTVSFTVLPASTVDTVRDDYRRLDTLARVLPLVAAGLVVAALVISPLRTRTVRSLAVGGVLGAALVWLAVVRARSRLTDAAAPENRALVDAVVTSTTGSLLTVAAVLAAVSAAVAVLTLFVGRRT
ncbi:hypothetical protein HMPREF0063_10186 [Aeromicrobium marinum DSM 15272]|uniref:Uncharacterized protein n=2 Tax=Aeromicrobium marinum TaxID=219314 RepID=E2S829_9ACTN|nr:hypothetical protein HMPREF0063_10186 [Aeromicrobium marinum DSM 15272]